MPLAPGFGGIPFFCGMKIHLLILFLILNLFHVFAQEEKGNCASIKSAFLNKSATLRPDQIRKTERYDVHYCKLDLELTHTSTYLSGTVRMDARARTVLDTVIFELFSSLAITGLEVNGSPAPYSRSGSAVLVPVNFASGESFSVSVSYNGNPPTSGSTAIGGSGLSTRASPTWGNSVTWSLSQPFSAYEWWPCKQSLRDKIDSVDVWLTVPQTCKGGSNGVLVQVTPLTNGKSRYEWKHRFPISYYLISVAVAEYVDYTVWAHPAGSDSIRIQNYIYNNPATLTNFQQDIDETADFMELFCRLYGPYPFPGEKYGHCMAPFSGGMEHQTMTTQGTFNRNLTAHELGHQWFGDHLTCASWADIWVNEGFATYSEYLMLENLYPGEEAQEMNGNHNAVLQQNNGSVWVKDSLNEARIFSSRLSYAKGAAILHTFRYILNNDSLFFRAMRKFNTRFADSTAIGTDFQRLLEEESGMDFSAAFEEWYFGEGQPTYTARWNNVSGDLHLRLSQTVSAPSVTPFFTTPLEISFRRTGLPDTIIRFPVTGTAQTFIVPGMGNVTSILAVDPRNCILNRTGLTTRDPSLVITSAGTMEQSGSSVVYPNPAGKVLFLTLPDGKPCRLRLLDPRGRCILDHSAWQGKTLDLTGYAPGYYHLILEQEGDPAKQTRHRVLKR